MRETRTLIEAEFNPKVRSYWLLNGVIILLATIVGVVLIPFWWIFGQWITARYLERMSCTLTEKSLKVERGILVRKEMTVPLDKITDVGLVEGPIMRWLDLQAVRIETAGQSTAGAAIQLVGVRSAREFRDAVLAQRDAVVDRVADRAVGTGLPAAEGDGSAGTGLPAATLDVLGEIRDTLRRIEGRLPSSDSDG
jgi:putative membrane protein